MPLLVKDLIKKGKERKLDKKNAGLSQLADDDDDLFEPWRKNSILSENKIIPFQGSKQDNLIDNEQDNKPCLNQITTREHPDNIAVTMRKQPDNNQITTREQTRAQNDNVTDIKSDNEQGNKLLRHHLVSLSGIQKNLFDYALDAATYNDGYSTGFIYSRSMADTIKCSYDSAKMTLNRLIQKGLLIRQKGKGCRGGYIILEIPRHVKNIHLELKRGINPGNGRDNKPEIMSSHYSNSNNKTTTTTENDHEKIDISPLEYIGLTQKHLNHFKNCPPEIIQDSINHFAWGLKNNKRLGEYTDPLNVFIGTLRKGIAWIEPSYMSPQEIAMQRLFEVKKAEQERVTALEEKMLDLEFSEWLANLSESQKEEIWPANKKGMPQEVALKLHFKETVWPDIKANVLRGT